MQIEKLIQKIVDFLPGLAAEEKDTKFVTLGALKAMMLLSAVDGDISRDEMKTFWDHAQRCKDIDSETLNDLWKSALTSAGYLAMQSLLMGKDELVAEFMRLVDADFVQRVTRESHEVRKNAFRWLKDMAEADGDYSDIEKACIGELVRIVREKWEIDVAIRAAHL